MFSSPRGKFGFASSCYVCAWVMSCVCCSCVSNGGCLALCTAVLFLSFYTFFKGMQFSCRNAFFFPTFTLLVYFALSGNVSFDTEFNRIAGRIPIKDASVRSCICKLIQQISFVMWIEFSLS